MNEIYLALDPGIERVGMALGESPKRIEWQGVVDRGEVMDTIIDLLSTYPHLLLILGDGTTSSSLKEELVERGLKERISIIDESYSTREGRYLYFKENSPRGWRRLLPTSLQTPPEFWDDYVARILLDRFFKKKK